MRTVSSWVLFSSVALLSFASCAPGEGGGDGGTDGGDVECEARCEGDTAFTCDQDGNETETDCTVDFSSCLEINGAVGCAAAVGESCLVDGILSLCEGTEAGCIDESDTIVCEEDVPQCEESEERSCDGEVFISDCEGGQPFRINCEAYAGICEDDTGCITPVDSFCDDFDFFCEDGLTCNDNICE